MLGQISAGAQVNVSNGLLWSASSGNAHLSINVLRVAHPTTSRERAATVTIGVVKLPEAVELANLRPSPPPVQQVLEQEPSTFKLRDGGGIISTADWFQPQEADLGSAVRQQWWQRIQEWDLVQRLDAHVQARARSPWLNEEEVQILRSDWAFFLKRCCGQRGDLCRAAAVSESPTRMPRSLE